MRRIRRKRRRKRKKRMKLTGREMRVKEMMKRSSWKMKILKMRESLNKLCGASD